MFEIEIPGREVRSLDVADATCAYSDRHRVEVGRGRLNAHLNALASSRR